MSQDRKLPVSSDRVRTMATVGEASWEPSRTTAIESFESSAGGV
jgi:hypothetical protein